MTLKIISKSAPFTCQPTGFNKPTAFITILASVVYSDKTVATPLHRFCCYINNNTNEPKNEKFTAQAFSTLLLASVGDNIICERMNNAYTPFYDERVFGIPIWDIVNLNPDKIDEDFDEEDYEGL